MTRTRIFIVHENSALASQVARLLNQDNQFHVMDLLTSASEALPCIGNGNCDFVLVSASLPKNGAMQLLKCLRQYHQAPKVIVTGLNDESRQILAYVAAGAAGYVLKQAGIHSWANHIHAIRLGKPLISPTITAAMMVHLNTLSRLTTRFEAKPGLYANLTERESEVLPLLAEGDSNEAIAEKLTIGVGTVKNHVHSVLKKLKLRSRKDTITYLSFVQRRTYATPLRYA